MEYGEAINSETFKLAVNIARRLRAERREPLTNLATEAVAQAYCVCVTDGEDAAEQRFSVVHKKLLDDVAERVRVLDGNSGPALMAGTKIKR